MAIDPKIDLKAAFEGREAKTQPETGEVPERIKNHTPRPALRPTGSWKARADAVDQRVREAQDAAKARQEWASRVKVRHKESMNMSFRRSARGG
jgi:hypothetical protein